MATTMAQLSGKGKKIKKIEINDGVVNMISHQQSQMSKFQTMESRHSDINSQGDREHPPPLNFGMFVGHGANSGDLDIDETPSRGLNTVYRRTIAEETEQRSPSIKQASRNAGRRLRGTGRIYSNDCQATRRLAEARKLAVESPNNFFSPDPRPTAADRMRQDREYFRNTQSSYSNRLYLPQQVNISDLKRMP